jgi:hypothetical protein
MSELNKQVRCVLLNKSGYPQGAPVTKWGLTWTVAKDGRHLGADVTHMLAGSYEAQTNCISGPIEAYGYAFRALGELARAQLLGYRDE